MNFSKFGKASGHAGEMDFEINIAPIIDCLTVLITFTLVSASFLSISIFDVGAAFSANTDSQKPPPVSIALVLKTSGAMEIQVTGQKSKTIAVPAADGGKYNQAGLYENMKDLRQSWPTVDAVSLSAEGRVDYKSIVKSMETVRAVYPAVLLGGF